MGNILIILGILITILGIVVSSGVKLKLPILPGDIFIQKENFTFYFPIVTTIILSLILTLIFQIFKK